ncbi:MAG: GntR family transcriptional regulator [Chloroflexi bacterium]|nr:GntR family transcriptional regulator [Chloroflexota bacterium]
MRKRLDVGFGTALPIKIDFRQRMPITEQIREQIRLLIARGVLRPGEQLPPVRQLAADLRINFNTVARAYRQLEEEGLISVQHGRGTFVLASPHEPEGDHAEGRHLEVLARHWAAQARALGFEVEEALMALRRAWQEDVPRADENLDAA